MMSSTNTRHEEIASCKILFQKYLKTITQLVNVLVGPRNLTIICTISANLAGHETIHTDFAAQNSWYGTF